MTCEQGGVEVLYGHQADWDWHAFGSNDSDGLAPVPGRPGAHLPSAETFPANWYTASGPAGATPTVVTSGFSMEYGGGDPGSASKIWLDNFVFGAFRALTPAAVCIPL